MLTLKNSFIRKLKLLSSHALIPHPQKKNFGGEDYFFISPDQKTIGVADGVGGWSDQPGANSAKYSHDLMNFCKNNSNLSDPLSILEKSYNQLDFSIKGSTTALVAKLKDKILHICNVGDSALSIYRDGKLIFLTEDSVHGFNFPKQLGYTKTDQPKDGTYDQIPVQKGDLLIAGTDGVWDNVWNEDIEKIIQKVMNLKDKNVSEKIKEIAEEIAKTANENGKNTEYYSPFAQSASNLGYIYNGGKLDDVTVVSSLVIDDND
ncbi:putative protein phosphatase 2C 80 [Histomonas meleagridis]|uniref:putative protein phosphatase 2C 80 n=1 Tax=Histomonas meleagridis TaxID=135588 RepID=UPI003559CB38|nr:putative protein phosphatase 2C 80 [Histomonas meleagridis]KAH0806934.1 putative protein phosphatase 2C 80 [Histomonas meleagridis]